MKASTLKYNIVVFASYAVLLIMALIPFHAFLTVWGASAFGHYTVLRLWKEVLLLVCAFAALYLVIFDAKIRTQTFTRRLLRVLLAYVVVTVVWALLTYARDMVSLKAAAYGCLLNLRFLLFFVICWALAVRTTRLHNHWFRVVMIPAAIVVGFGLLQIFALPHDILRHFGYNDSTIPAFETINHNINYIRIQSFLRGANPLGVYLIVPLSVVVYWLLRRRTDWRLWAALVAGILVLIYSFSRSAWIGFILSAVTLIVLRYGAKISRAWWLAGATVSVAIIALGFVVVHQNTRLENIFLHTQSNSSIATSSNGGHIDALQQGVSDVITEPLGRGPGSAGPASVYNNHPARIAENYFLQIGQEVGWIGLGLFIAIQIGVGYILWLRRSEPLACILLAALVGITFVNLLSHAWTDDTIAYLWWGLAGIALVPTPTKHKKR